MPPSTLLRMSFFVFALTGTACDSDDDLLALDAERESGKLDEADLALFDIEEVDGTEKVLEFDLAARTPVAFNSCSGYGCDGMDPDYTGCSSGAELIKQITIDIPWTAKNAYVEQWYSSACKTRWTRVRSTSYGYKISTNARIKRKISGVTATDTYPDDYNEYLNSYLNWTDMLYCPRSTCTAESFGKVKHDNAIYSAATFWLQ